MRTDVFASSDLLAATAAREIHDRIRREPGRPYLLGCPGGRSLAPTYEALAALVAADGTDLSDLVIVMMDDYVVPGRRGGFVRVDPALAYSCERFARDNIVDPLASVAPMRSDALWLPDPGDPGAYDDRIADLGGIDLFLLASGDSDGHIAFNPPGSSRMSRTRVVELAETTRRDNLATFPVFAGEITSVPSHGVTVGIESIQSLSASVLMVCTGPGKASAVARVTAASRYEPDWPATILVECRDPRLLIDREAADAAAASIASFAPAR